MQKYPSEPWKGAGKDVASRHGVQGDFRHFSWEEGGLGEIHSWYPLQEHPSLPSSYLAWQTLSPRSEQKGGFKAQNRRGGSLKTIYSRCAWAKSHAVMITYGRSTSQMGKCCDPVGGFCVDGTAIIPPERGRTDS